MIDFCDPIQESIVSSDNNTSLEYSYSLSIDSIGDAGYTTIETCLVDPTGPQISEEPSNQIPSSDSFAYVDDITLSESPITANLQSDSDILKACTWKSGQPLGKWKDNSCWFDNLHEAYYALWRRHPQLRSIKWREGSEMEMFVKAFAQRVSSNKTDAQGLKNELHERMCLFLKLEFRYYIQC